MEESKALHRLTEVADLVGMVEEILNPAMIERLSPASLSGIRITLRNVREGIQSSHAALASDLVARSRVSTSPIASPSATPIIQEASVKIDPIAPRVEQRNPVTQVTVRPDVQKIQMTRRDLKASIEKLIDRPVS